MSNAQRIGCGPVRTRRGLIREKTHQQNISMQTTSAGRPTSVVPGRIKRAGITVSRANMNPSSIVASMRSDRRRVR
jgi:hypothetical protein